jgi:hypothetical protein
MRRTRWRQREHGLKPRVSRDHRKFARLLLSGSRAFARSQIPCHSAAFCSRFPFLVELNIARSPHSPDRPGCHIRPGTRERQFPDSLTATAARIHRIAVEPPHSLPSSDSQLYRSAIFAQFRIHQLDDFGQCGPRCHRSRRVEASAEGKDTAGWPSIKNQPTLTQRVLNAPFCSRIGRPGP